MCPISWGTTQPNLMHTPKTAQTEPNMMSLQLQKMSLFLISAMKKIWIHLKFFRIARKII